MSKEKIRIELGGVNRPNLVELFHEHLRNKKNVSYSRRGGMASLMDEYRELCDYWDRMYPGWDDEPDADACVVFPMVGDDGVTHIPSRRGKGNSKKRRDPYNEFWQMEREESWYNGKRGSKKPHRKKKSRARLVDINKPMDGYIGEDDFSFDDISFGGSHSSDDDVRVFYYPDYHVKDDCVEFNSLLDFCDFCERNGFFVPGYVQDDLIYRKESHCCLNPIPYKKGVAEIAAEASYGELFYEVCEPSELSV